MSQTGSQQSVVNPRAEAVKRAIEQQKLIAEKMKNIKYKLVVLSGKGGVGKSFVTASLAMALALKGRKVAVFDADIHGPSIPKMLGVHGKRMYALPDGSLLPVDGPLGVKVVSVDFLLESEEQAVIWRGPLKTAAIRELLAYTFWGDLDYLLVDLPPGTGDEQLTIAQLIPNLTGAIIVTIPSDVARIVVKKAVTFAKRLNIPIIGVIENMSYFECPDGSRHYIFGKGAGRKIAEEMGVPFLGEIPIDPRISKANDEGKPFFVEYPDSPASKAFLEIAEKIIERVEGRSGEKS